jgi:hypothetical protein
VHRTLGILPHFRVFSSLRVFSTSQTESTPAPAPVTQTFGAAVASCHLHRICPYKPKERNIKMSEPDHKVFIATIQKEGSFTFVAIPFSPREIWGARPRYPVSGTINDIAVRGTLGALGKDYFLRLAAAWLRDSGIEAGAKVTVRLSLTEPLLSSLNKD